MVQDVTFLICRNVRHMFCL